MDGVILIAIIVPAVMALFSMFLHLVNNTGGTKGITQPYKTKSGKTHTAKKEREQFIV
tara:strand:- start:5185 stop:5358 length:174 start_codon:yes stop_codon:yes gene_type:complete